MPESWKYHVQVPILTSILAEQVQADADAEGRRAKAFNTPFRYSDAGSCSRKMAFDFLGKTPERFDAAGHWVTWLGKLIHDSLQEAIAQRFPGAQFEVPSVVLSDGGIELGSGHADALIDTGRPDLGRVLYELKTVGGYAFDKAIGLKRKARKLGDPDGPRMTAVLQAGINALANDCDTVIIGYLSRESVSKSLAGDARMTNLDRFAAEWHIPRSVWEPLAEAELTRQRMILSIVENGGLPMPDAMDDDGDYSVLAGPLAQRVPWQCDYCSHRFNCEESYS